MLHCLSPHKCCHQLKNPSWDWPKHFCKVYYRNIVIIFQLFREEWDWYYFRNPFWYLLNKYPFSLLQLNIFPNRPNSQNFWFVVQSRQIMNNWGGKLLLTIPLLSRLFILLLVLPVLSHLRAPSCFLALWGSSCFVSLSCGLEKFPLASFFWLWSATSRSFPWDLSAGRFRGVLTHGLNCLECC